ncbi:FCD domain-containing protein (plasmid) [Gemmobacter fulvus]|uniref:FCD domain-containing protein n=1 Tax=Gemmobacter fulvus TaxID=2840474 RepID=A0A975PAC7_9RHOB|nr:FCD domain-containing protein [Gemmobacter fulvus]MBT9246146.1 FCD domain-containing protein [Gemmobacter fulvus]MDQ1850108.1 FCD domain-containing protein [Gemmobacter fulvus]QWK92103.1 FCD domain-containing protein [Gemmobacter fulvus]
MEAEDAHGAQQAAELPPGRRMRRIKLSDQVAEELRRWIARDNLGPKDRLPPEKVLMQHFGCSKGTIREALKALEVEGLLVMQSGANGGPEIQATTTETVIQQMRQYFHFQQLDFEDVYELRKKLEVMLAENVVGKLTEDHFRRLQANIDTCIQAMRDDDREAGRVVEVQFHDILAEACDNPILDLMCRFLNVMVRDLVLRRTDSLREHSAFGQQNIDAHIELIEALRREDRDAVSAAMGRHMHCAECSMKELDATFHLDLLSRQ